MSTHVVLLRAVNVGGTGALPMADLRRLAQDAGFTGVRTYIASGNLLVESDDDADAVGRTIAAALADYAGRPVDVLVRSPQELARVLAANPFPDAPGNRVSVYFLPVPTPSDAADRATGADDGEEVRVGKRAVYVHYPNGMGRSRLRLPAAAVGTARNLNTVAKLVELCGER